jgi:hypothetical protein
MRVLVISKLEVIQSKSTETREACHGDRISDRMQT